jgi:hypothetical protein
MRKKAMFGIAAALVATAALLAAQGSEAAQPATASVKVIVVLNDQLASTPAGRTNMRPRRVEATTEQNGVIAGLRGATPTKVKHFALGNAFAATVTKAQATALAADPRVASVVPDKTVAMPAPAAVPTGSSAQSFGFTPSAPTTPSSFAVCPTDPAQPLIEPEALESIRALTPDGSPNAQQLATGAGVKVAYIADSIDPNNPDFIRPNGDHVFVDYQDFSGDGPSAPGDGREAFGDASSIAAQGTVVHDISNFVNPSYPLPAGCNIRVVGVAPGASLVGLVFSSNSSILQAIDYAVSTDHVDVLNESFGLNSYPDISMRNALTLFNDAAVGAGVTVTVSSGDAGITNTIGSPPDPKVIQVGATTDNRLYQQTGYAGARAFGNGKWADDEISALSSSGLTQYARTVDLVAPGEGNWAVCEPGYSGCVNFRGQPSDLQSFGGTSESAPLTAGVAALVIQAYRSTHSGASPTPALIKQFITGTANDLGLPADEQGAGLLNARGAVEAALSYKAKTSVPASVGSQIFTSTSQFTLTGKPGEKKTGDVTVTNAGTKKVTVTTGARGFAPLSSDPQITSISSAALPTFPYPTNGAPWGYKQVQFTVPAGADRLLARMAFQQTSASGVVRESLFAPDGTYVANSRPQGNVPNYSNIDVRTPVAGTWTAVLYTPHSGGYNGQVQLQFETQKITSVGKIDPASFTLNAGQSKVVHAAFTLPASGGDTDYAVTFSTSEGQKTAVSAVLDTLIDTSKGGAYSGTITGGNARAVSPGQTFSYGFDVPGGKKDLDVSFKLGSGDPNNIVDLVLLDPNGELADVGSNVTCDSTGSCISGLNAQLFDANPMMGRWRLVIVVQNPVSGAELSQAYTGTITFDGLKTTATGLPHGGPPIPAGHAVTATVTVHNTGVQPILVGTDPRLDGSTTLAAPLIQGSASFPLPDSAFNSPTYLIPPDTTGLTVTATSTIPAQLEIQGSAAGFDVFGSLADAKAGNLVSTATISENKGEISKGIWFTSMSEIGPFTDAGQASGQTTLTATMQTAPFDPNVTSSTDDPFQAPNIFGTPEQIQPGATGTIQVTFMPTGSKGATIHGHLNIVTLPVLPTSTGTGLPFYSTGSTIATLPYDYKIK